MRGCRSKVTHCDDGLVCSEGQCVTLSTENCSVEGSECVGENSVRTCVGGHWSAAGRPPWVAPTGYAAFFFCFHYPPLPARERGSPHRWGRGQIKRLMSQTIALVDKPDRCCTNNCTLHIAHCALIKPRSHSTAHYRLQNGSR